MAEFEGKINLNVETSEIEIKGKFKLAEEELDKVAGGDERPLYIPVSDYDTCDEWKQKWSSSSNRQCRYCYYLLGDIQMVCKRPGGPVNLQRG